MFTEIDKNNLLLTVFSSILAANGLISNNITRVICSVLVSPYIYVIINIANDLYVKQIVKHNYLLLGSYMSISFFVGIFYYLIYKNITKEEIIKDNSEMNKRGDINIKDFISMFIFAFVCGILLSFINNKKLSISISIGIGIGVSLLPPMVNSGMFIIENNRKYAFNSILTTIINIIGIILGILSYKYITK